MDVTDDQVHGNQEGAFFNTYYQGVCYAPLYIFCGHHLLVAKLRSSNVDPADGALEELQRVIGLIRKEWPLWFSSIAYVLMQAFRHHCLSKTSFAYSRIQAIPDTD